MGAARCVPPTHASLCCPPPTRRCARFFAPVASILAHLILSLFSARSQAHHPEGAPAAASRRQ